ncbi:SDR family oxidoreductase [Eudoraea chungangensis]|uniref:SDR family oxidoreductase n=1 Tax=Eudoraea chungangensis TaxID=1481905 RepID=UPI0023EC0856|nr:SDR family oxidoreductase [Eudoraea chungangensis]
MTKKIALVTGAGTGIGRAAAIVLGKEGWSVVLTGRTNETLEQTASYIKNSSTTIILSDIRDPESVERLFNEITTLHGRLDFLFNNAGINVKSAPIEEFPLSDWENVIDTNLNGAFLCLKQAFKIMKKQHPIGGRIINNGSISAQTPRPFSVAYNASKHAISGLTKSAALEGRKYNICCGQIDIGNAESDMTQKMTRGILQADGSLQKEPTIEVAHVGNAIAYLANLPLDVNIPFFTIMANQMPFIGRG